MTQEEKKIEEGKEGKRVRIAFMFLSKHKWIIGTCVLIGTTLTSILGWGFNTFYFNKRTSETVYENKLRIDSVEAKVNTLERRQDADDIKNEGVKEDLEEIKEMLNIWIFGRDYPKNRKDTLYYK